MKVLALAAAVALASPVPTPLHAAVAPAALQAEADADEKATAWPTADDEAAVKRSVSKLRKARNEEMEAGGRAEVIAAGPAAAPILLRALGKEKDAAARARITDALDAVTAVQHTRLLAAHLEESSDALRRYAVRRVAVLGDAGLLERADALMEALEERAANPKARKKVDPLDLDLAAVLCLSTGSPRGLGRVLVLAEPESWVEWRETLRPASAGARAAGDEVARSIAGTLLGAEEVSDRVAALNLLAYAGSKELSRAVLPSLDAEENQVKVAAINALRMMVDGDPPLDKLSTFDAIERANRWKSRL
ncbi:MAG: hypothetical protein AAF726_23465 [Planctomycetota bacterium]